VLITIDDKDPRPIYRQIVDEVRRGIVLGTLSPEDSLPSLRQLAAELRVNPNTVQQAYRELEREGLVYVRRGQGTFVAATEDGRPTRERNSLAASVAGRALREAHRHGLDAEELIRAIRKVSGDRATKDRGAGGPEGEDG